MGMQRFPQEQAGELAPMGPAGVRAYPSETVRSGSGQAPTAAVSFRMEAGDVLRRQFRRRVLRRAARVGRTVRSGG